jgi:DNA-directed RNA polymerase subunit RPC12/RpoP
MPAPAQPMTVTYACPRCDQTVRADVPSGATLVGCEACRSSISIPAGAYENGKLNQCLVCPSTDLFVRKDFSQRLGVSIVVAGFAASCVTWYLYMPYWTYGILFATAAVDVVLYFLVPNCLNCYRCNAQYRGLPDLDSYEAFNLETHERYRQQEIRLREATAEASRRQPSNTAQSGAAPTPPNSGS